MNILGPTPFQLAEKRAGEAEEALKEAEEKCASLGVELEELRSSSKDASADRFQKENHQLQTRFNYLEVQFREKVLVLEKTAEELARARKEVERYESISATMESSIQREKDTASVLADGLRQEVDKLRASRDEALAREAESERALAALRLAKEDVETRLARLQTDSARDLAAAEAAAADKDRDLAQLREKEAQIRADRDAASASLTHLQASLDSANAGLAQIQASLDEAKAPTSPSQPASMTRPMMSLQATLETRDAQITELKSHLEESEEELKVLRNVKASVDAAVESERKESEARLAEVEKVNESLNAQIVQLGSVVSAYEKTTDAAPADAPTEGSLSPFNGCR